jgi:hypothetical protein
VLVIEVNPVPSAISSRCVSLFLVALRLRWS